MPKAPRPSDTPAVVLPAGVDRGTLVMVNFDEDATKKINPAWESIAYGEFPCEVDEVAIDDRGHTIMRSVMLPGHPESCFLNVDLTDGFNLPTDPNDLSQYVKAAVTSVRLTDMTPEELAEYYETIDGPQNPLPTAEEVKGPASREQRAKPTH